MQKQRRVTLRRRRRCPPPNTRIPHTFRTIPNFDSHFRPSNHQDTHTHTHPASHFKAFTHPPSAADVTCYAPNSEKTKRIVEGRQRQRQRRRRIFLYAWTDEKNVLTLPCMKEEEVGVEDTFCNNVIVIGLSLLGQTTRSGTSRRRRKLPSLSSTKFFLFYVLMSTTCDVVSQRSERTTFSRKERMRERGSAAVLRCTA